MIFKGGLKPHEILYWYDLVKECEENRFNKKVFCKQKNISYPMFSEMAYRIKLDLTLSDFEYQQLSAFVAECEKTHKPFKIFALSKGVNHVKLDRMKRHLYYKKIIENRDNLSELQIEPEPVKVDEPMGFIKISSNVPTPVAAEPIQAPVEAPVAEIIPSKNDIEIVIAQGVKVIISPSVDSMKIIKIIDLLKDL